jgi:hypothetical protein
VKLIGSAQLKEITPAGLSITTDNNQQLLKADKIIPALPLSPNLELLDKIKGKVAEIYVVGDCSAPGIIPDSTAAGWEVGNKI